jgi:hypothetical protein
LNATCLSTDVGRPNTRITGSIIYAKKQCGGILAQNVYRAFARTKTPVDSIENGSYCSFMNLFGSVSNKKAIKMQ